MSILETTFTAFYEGWFSRHQQLQQQLTTTTYDNANHEKQLRKLVEQASQHYSEYYQEKSTLIDELVSSPPWFTSFEQTLFWVTEFPPSLVFRFVKVESFKVDTLYGLVNRVERLVDGEVSQLDDAMEQVKEAMRVVVAEADGLRVNVVKQVLELLDVVQRVELFAVVGQYRIRIRQVGLQMTPTQTL